MLSEYVSEYLMACRARRLSEHTLRSYADSLDSFGTFANTQDVHELADVDRVLVEKWLIQLAESHSPGTTLTRYRSLRAFFRWCVLEEELDRSPMQNMREPRGEQKPPRVPADDELRAVLATISGKSFKARRDTALIRFLADTGCRAREALGIRLEDVDAQAGTAVVYGKGSKVRVVAFGPKTAQALMSYLRARRAHPHASEEHLWLTRFGKMEYSALHRLVKERGEAAGVALSPHALRHRFAHTWIAAGGPEIDLAALGGWSSSQVMARYGRSVAAERARDTHRRLAIGDAL